MSEDQQHRLEYTLYILEESLLGEIEDTKLVDDELEAVGRYGAYKLGEMNSMKDTLYNLTGYDKWSRSLKDIKKSLLKGDNTYER